MGYATDNSRVLYIRLAEIPRRLEYPKRAAQAISDTLSHEIEQQRDVMFTLFVDAGNMSVTLHAMNDQKVFLKYLTQKITRNFNRRLITRVIIYPSTWWIKLTISFIHKIMTQPVDVQNFDKSTIHAYISTDNLLQQYGGTMIEKRQKY
jgi:hypothetical protein